MSRNLFYHYKRFRVNEKVLFFFFSASTQLFYFFFMHSPTKKKNLLGLYSLVSRMFFLNTKYIKIFEKILLINLKKKENLSRFF